MSRTESSMVELGTVAPEFELVDVVTGKSVNLHDVRGSSEKAGLLLMFICVHCPYVKHVEEELASDWQGLFWPIREGPDCDRGDSVE